LGLLYNLSFEYEKATQCFKVWNKKGALN
jgi:hypothetical protein